MTLDQIEYVLREMGWRGRPGTGPEVSINGNAFSFGEMWIEKGMVVFKTTTSSFFGPVSSSKQWMDPGEITQIGPSILSKYREPHLRVVD